MSRTPTSILKKTKVYESVDRNISMDGVSLNEPHIYNDADMSDLESEESTLCLRENSEKSDSLFGLDHAPAPGNPV